MMRIQTLLNWCLFRFCFKDLSWRLYSPSKLFGGCITTIPFSSQPQLRWCSLFSLFPTALCFFPYLWCSSWRFLRPRWFLCSICFFLCDVWYAPTHFCHRVQSWTQVRFFWWESGVWRGFLGQCFRLRNLAQSISLLRHWQVSSNLS